jgi:hypothetical protein
MNRLAIFRSHPRRWAIVLLLLTTWVAHFWYFREMGLYEDDYTFTAVPIGWGWNDLGTYLIKVWTVWQQGRPLGFSLSPLTAFLASQAAGLPGIYVAGFLILALNVLLMFWLTERLSASSLFAFLGALTFALFPADTTRSFLMHLTGLQPAITFLLLALILYTSGQRLPAYLSAAAILLIYESPFFPFVAAPLFANKWDRATVRRLLGHGAICATIFVAVALLRLAMGEERAQDAAANLVTLTGRALASLFLGPATTVMMFAYRFFTPLLNLDLELAGLILVFVILLVGGLWLLLDAGSQSNQLPANRWATLRAQLISPQRRAVLAAAWSEYQLNIMVAALLSLALGYALAFTHYPPTTRFGRETSVHLAAAVGGSLVAAWAGWALVRFFRNTRWQWAVVGGLSVYFASLVGFGVVIQRDFALAWHNQQSFWSAVLPQAPDLKATTTILVVTSDPLPTKYIMTFGWLEPTMLFKIYRLPADWHDYPRLYFVHPGWTRAVKLTGDKFYWNTRYPPWWYAERSQELEPGNVIVFEMIDGKPIRQTGTLEIGGRSFELKPIGESATLQYNYLYYVFVDPPR